MITLKNVSKYYRSSNGITMGLRKINLEFHKGEFVAITGESGSGKSTLLNVLSGSDTYEEGEMYLYGYPTSHYGKTEWELYRKDYISFIYQNYNLIDSYTALENVESALIMSVTDRKKRREKALQYLEIAGLKEQAEHRGTQLSSGQKQRLSIARALAKETDIIVADEPTGNLDTENAMTVINLLHKLSKEKLVIMVTHNYEQVKDYATRKIRLYGGEVAEDIMLNGNERKADEEKADFTKKPFKDSVLFMSKQQIYAKNKELKSDRKLYRRKKWDELKRRISLANRFVNLNRRAQPRRNILIAAFFLCVMFSFFVFMGNFIGSIDDASSKEYFGKAFLNGDNTRIEIAKLDKTVSDENDIEKILGIDHVIMADTYDTVHDINYFMYEGEDYDIVYRVPQSENSLPETQLLNMIDKSKYMKSEQCLSDEKLTAGRLPEAADEVVLSSDDKSLLGKEVRMYFHNASSWDDMMYVGMDMKVVGITDITDSQAYFDTDFCMQMSTDINKVFSTIYTQTFEPRARGLVDEIWGGFTENTDDLKEYDDRFSRKRAYKQNYVLYIINDELAVDEVRFSKSFYDNYYVSARGGAATQYSIYKDVLVKSQCGDDIVIKCANAVEGESISGRLVIEISRNLYNVIYKDYVNGNNQMCAYIEDYAYTDAVINDIKALGGYEAVSVYRVGATEYSYDKVMEKLQTVLISLGALAVVFILGNFIIFMIMKLKKGDFIIFKALGMEQKVVNDINFMDMYTNVIFSTTFVVILAFTLDLFGVDFIHNILKYYRWYHIIVLYVLGILMSYLIAGRFNRYLLKNDKITSLRED